MQCLSQNLRFFPLLSYFTFFKSCREFFSKCNEIHRSFSKMQGSFTRFFPARCLNCLGFIKNFPACRPAACKKFKQSQLGICPSIQSIQKSITAKHRDDWFNEMDDIGPNSTLLTVFFYIILCSADRKFKGNLLLNSNEYLSNVQKLPRTKYFDRNRYIFVRYC